MAFWAKQRCANCLWEKQGYVNAKASIFRGGWMNNRRCLSRGINFSAFGKIFSLYRLFNYFQQRLVIAALGRGLLYPKKNFLFWCSNCGGEFNYSAGWWNGPEYQDCAADADIWLHETTVRAFEINFESDMEASLSCISLTLPTHGSYVRSEVLTAMI